MGERTSVYVHFPWCLAKCPYCDFASGAIVPAEIPHARYAEAVIAELTRRSGSIDGRTLASVFFGGGTPSLWAPDEVARVLEAIRAAFAATEPDLEITLECNPSSLDETGARAFASAGIGRLSIGVQALDDTTLRFLGRLHDGAGALRALEGAGRAVERVSADLMFGSHGQPVERYLEHVARVLDTEVEHLSAYALTIEPATQFGALHAKGKLPLAPEDDAATAFVHTEELLGARGFAHYEVSNYARPGAECRHNLHTWRGGDYLGLGSGAVGCLAGEDLRARRWRNDPRPERWMEGAGEVESEVLDPEARVREAWMLGLRTAEGVDLAEVERRTGLDPRAGRARAIERRAARGDLVIDGARARVPSSRWLFLDAIVTDLF